jgi:hypothetical protein
MPSPVSEAREQACDVRLALLNPAAEGDFAAEILKLNLAIDRLREVKLQIGQARPGSEERAVLEQDLRALRNDLDRLGRLAGHGEAFWRGWARVLGLDTSGYTPAGLPVSLSAEQAARTVAKG